MKNLTVTLPPLTNTAAQFTILTSQYPKVLSKEIRLDNTGSMIKIPSANLCTGTATVKSVTSIFEFADIISKLNSNQALTYGVPTNGITDAKIVTKNEFDKGSNEPNLITRSKQHFEWPVSAGIMMFDYDPDDEALEKDVVLKLLYTVCPQIKKVDHIWWISSSSNIVNEKTGKHLSAVTGQRIYLMVKDASDIPRAAKLIEERLWLAGFGSIKVSASGSILERVPFDMCVYQPSRMDFAAGASCIPPLIQDRGKPLVMKGSESCLDTKLYLVDLNSSEIQKLNEMKLGKRAVAEPIVLEHRSQYAQDMIKKLKVNNKSIQNEEYTEEIIETLNTGELLPYWIIHLWNGQEMIERTVQDILSDKTLYHGLLCLDPIEPDYDNRRLVGKLFLKQDQPCLFSFARGQKTYRLLEYIHSIKIEGNIHNAVNDTLQILKSRKDVFSFGGVLVTPIDGSLIYLDQPHMKHLLSGFIHYYSLRKPCNPTNELIDGVSSIGASKNINPITGFVDHPVVDRRLRLLLEPGYNRQMKLLAEFDSNDFAISDHKLSEQEVMFHFNRLYAPFSAFELAENDDKTVIVAAIFSAVLRQVLPTCPAFGIDAPMQGTGKTMLAETIAIIGTGKSASAIAPGRRDNDEEFRKRLMSLFLKGEKVCNFDNIVEPFDSPSFAAALTTEYYEDRILGKSKTVKTMNKTLFLLTGNNMQFVGDMNRRVIKARLISNSNNLMQRQFDFDPRELALETRYEIISSVMTLINHWKHCGKPLNSGRMTSFNDWDSLVRQPLAFIGQQHPKTGLVDILNVTIRQQQENSDNDALLALLKSLSHHFGTNNGFKATKLLYDLHENLQLADAIFAFISRDRLQSSQHVGNLLRQFLDRNIDGLVLRGKRVSGSYTYWVECTDDSQLTLDKHNHKSRAHIDKLPIKVKEYRL